jgi:hypothetical protein
MLYSTYNQNRNTDGHAHHKFVRLRTTALSVLAFFKTNLLSLKKQKTKSLSHEVIVWFIILDVRVDTISMIMTNSTYVDQ